MVFEVPVRVSKDQMRSASMPRSGKYAEILEYAREHRVETRELAEGGQSADNDQS